MHRIERIERHCSQPLLAGGRAGAGPHHLAAGDQFVQQRRPVITHTHRKHRFLPYVDGQTDAFELLHDAHHAIHAFVAFATKGSHTLPVKHKGLELRRLHGFDRFAGLGERFRPDALEHIGVHPLRHIHRKPVVEPAGEHLAGSV